MLNMARTISFAIEEVMEAKKPRQAEIILPNGERRHFYPKNCTSRRMEERKTMEYVKALEEQVGRTLAYRFAGEKMYRFSSQASLTAASAPMRGLQYIKHKVAEFFDLD